MILAHLSLPTRSFLLLPASFNGGDTCGLCRTFAWDRLLPVVTVDGGDEVDQAASQDSLPLCRACGYRPYWRYVAGWPALTNNEFAALWQQVRAEQAKEAYRLLDSERLMVKTSLETVQAALRAAQESAPDQGVDHFLRSA